MKLVTLLLFIAATTANASKEPESINNFSLHFRYKNGTCNFSKNTFQNFAFYNLNHNGSVSERITLKSGKYDSGWHNGSTDVEFLWAYQVDDGLWIVATAWEWVGGSSSQDTIVQVFSCEDDRPIVVQQISGDAHSEHAGASFDPKAKVLKVKSVDYGKGAHCCPEFLDITNFHWRTNHLVFATTRKIKMPGS